ncbi:MAG TPA: ROK family protein [archaeon]|nr:ROK family protein [archaeon]
MGSLLGAVDLGGTKIISGLFSPEKDLLGDPVECPTQAHLDPEKILENIRENFLRTLEKCGRSIKDVASLGIGVPITVQYDKGLIDGSPNLPTMTDFPLARLLAQRLQLPVMMEKDANCFILGEMTHGAAEGSGNCCGVTIGTGLGLGILSGGRLLRGSNACAGEIWTCPYRDGILEDYVSGTALVKRYEKRSGQNKSGPEIHQLAAEGDKLARELFTELGRALGHGLSYLVNLLNPEIIVIGGSVAEAYDLFIEPVQEVIGNHRVERNSTVLKKSGLGKLACLYGAAFLTQRLQ